MWGQWETIRKQDVRKADTPSNIGAHMRGDNGREWGAWGTRGDKTLKRRAHHSSKGTMEDDKGRQDLATHHPTQTHIVGRQSETSGDKTSGRQTHHPTQAHVGRQWETMADKGEAREGRHTITGTHVGRQWETKREDNTSGRQTHHPTQANVWGDNARQCAQWDRRGEKGRRDLGKADTPSNTGTHVGRQ